VTRQRRSMLFSGDAQFRRSLRGLGLRIVNWDWRAARYINNSLALNNAVRKFDLINASRPRLIFVIGVPMINETQSSLAHEPFIYTPYS